MYRQICGFPLKQLLDLEVLLSLQKKSKGKKNLWKQIVYIAESSLFILPISLFPDNWLLLLFLFTVCSEEF